MVEKTLVPHKHAKVIKAWAEGSQIQYSNIGENKWKEVVEPRWFDYVNYRVKPEVVKPKWPTLDLPREIFLTLIDEYECDGHTIIGVANAAIAHALETGLVVLPGDTVKPAQIDYKKDAEAWGGALNEAAWTFIESNPEKSALLFNTCKTSLRATILKYLECVERDVV